jgi:hypothetical protein
MMTGWMRRMESRQLSERAEAGTSVRTRCDLIMPSLKMDLLRNGPIPLRVPSEAHRLVMATSAVQAGGLWLIWSA